MSRSHQAKMLRSTTSRVVAAGARRTARAALATDAASRSVALRAALSSYSPSPASPLATAAAAAAAASSAAASQLVVRSRSSSSSSADAAAERGDLKATREDLSDVQDRILATKTALEAPGLSPDERARLTSKVQKLHLLETALEVKEASARANKVNDLRKAGGAGTPEGALKDFVRGPGRGIGGF